MPYRDNYSHIEAVQALGPVSVSDNTAQVGEIVDTQDCDAVTFTIQAGALGTEAATFAVKLEEGDEANLSDAATVADGDTISTQTAAAFTGANANSVRKLGYIGVHRYVRLTLTPASNAAAALLSATAVKSRLQFQPAA